ncbi:MAG: hypothetical protein ACI310_01015 [Bacilli bacterium]
MNYDMKETKRKKIYTFRCVNTKVSFDDNGYIVEASNFSNFMWWCTQNIDEKLVGKHITELARLIKENALNVDVYINFLENVVLKFYEISLKNYKKTIDSLVNDLESQSDVPSLGVNNKERVKKM